MHGPARARRCAARLDPQSLPPSPARYQETPAGARVRITTANSEARSAVHLFLKYQIREHGTGDSQGLTK
jgi:hypothetical protein